MKRALLCVLLAFVASACGHSPTSPSPNPNPQPQKTTFTVARLDNGSPVSGAQFTLGVSQTFTTNASGQVEVDSPSGETTITVIASGYLKRETLASKGNTITLFPLDAGVDEAFVGDLIYDHLVSGKYQPLYRSDPGTFCLQMPSAISESWMVQAALEGAQRTARAFDRISVVATAGACPAGTNVVDVTHNPTPGSTSGGFKHDNGRIYGGFIQLQYVPTMESVEFFKKTIAHEFGHVLGLNHIAEPGLMHTSQTLFDYTPKELRAVQLIQARRVGNTFPDNDRNVK